MMISPRSGLVGGAPPLRRNPRQTRAFCAHRKQKPRHPCCKASPRSHPPRSQASRSQAFALGIAIRTEERRQRADTAAFRTSVREVLMELAKTTDAGGCCIVAGPTGEGGDVAVLKRHPVTNDIETTSGFPVVSIPRELEEQTVKWLQKEVALTQRAEGRFVVWGSEAEMPEDEPTEPESGNEGEIRGGREK